MANTFIKAEKVVNTALGVLDRELVLPGLVWRDAGGSFVGTKNDTISIRLPAYMAAKSRVMRSATAIDIDELDETKVDVTLDTHAYKAIGVSDEEMTLDIADFGTQVLRPALGAVARKVEDTLATEISGATYEKTVTLNEDDPYLGLVDARIDLNKANVPPSQRFLAVGSSVEAAILKSDRLSKFDQAGSDSALREAMIGRIAGFTAVSVPGLDPDIAVAAHQTAFVLSMQAPVVPAGAAWGASQTYNGFAVRALRDYDPKPASGPPQDRLLTDVFIGTNTVMDRGTLDTDGRFVPSDDGTDDPILVRAVKCTLGSASS